MKTAIIYKSKHLKNTEQIVRILNQEIEADVFNLSDNKKIDLSSYDRIGLGSGIYFGKFDEELIDFIRNNELKQKKVFVFSTSGIRAHICNNFEEDIKRELLEKEVEIIGFLNIRAQSNYAFLKFFGGMNKGRPNEEDFKKVKKFVFDFLK